MAGSEASVAIEFFVRYFRQLASLGIDRVVVSPGSRSTPLTLGAHAAGLGLSIQIDERSGAFYALGLASALRRPVALVCTSGTAAANYLPAVVEASHSRIPLLVFTADRPPELRGWGASQTIDQVGMYGANVRWFFDAPVASAAPPEMAGSLAARTVLEATGPRPGPVHVNFPLREPLIDPTGIPEIVAPQRGGIGVVASVVAARDDEVQALAAMVRAHQRGVIIAGPAHHDAAAVAAIARFADTARWPILAETTSQLRTGPHVAEGLVVAGADLLLRSDAVASAMAPDVAVMVGASPTSKPTRRWLEQSQPREVVVTGSARDLPDPAYLATMITDVPGAVLARSVADAVGDVDRDPEWVSQWRMLDDAATSTMAALLAGTPLTEPSAMRSVADAVPAESAIYLSNSMPVRDADTVWPATTEARRFFSHRGAAGIDGLTAAAAGAAAGLDRPTVLLTGDLAFLHDIGGLMAAAREAVPLVVVVLDNGGGGIFRVLPVAEAIPAGVFDRLFTTPHGMDLPALATAVGIACVPVETAAELETAVAEACCQRTPTVIYVTVDTTAGVAVRDAVTAAAGEAAYTALAG